MSEEATHASRAVPLGIISSAGLCGVLGWLSLAVIAACMSTDIDGILNSKFGQPMAQVCFFSDPGKMVSEWMLTFTIL